MSFLKPKAAFGDLTPDLGPPADCPDPERHYSATIVTLRSLSTPADLTKQLRDLYVQGYRFLHVVEIHGDILVVTAEHASH